VIIGTLEGRARWRAPSGVAFLSAAVVSLKFTYDFMGECLALPPSEYASSAELHFSLVLMAGLGTLWWLCRLKKLGLVYIHQDGKMKYSILDPSEKGITRDTSQAIDLSTPGGRPPGGGGGGGGERPAEEVKHVQITPMRPQTKE
jgi:hypothetical protein